MDVYSIGEMVIDFIPGAEPASYIRNAGGAPANVAIAVAKNGLEAGMCCSVGDDNFGHFLVDTLKQHNVRCMNSRLCGQAITTMAFVTLAPDGDRSFTFARKPGADMFLQESDVKEEDIADSVIVHAGSCSLSASPVAEATIRALRLGRQMNKLVSFDINYRDVMWDGNQAACMEKVYQVLPFVDILKISEEEVEMIGGVDHIFEQMETYRLTLVVETLGSHGARCFFRGRVLEEPGKKAVCLDATGAGDAFWGGFLSSLRLQGVHNAEQLNEEILRTAMVYGNVAGAICVQSKGAIPALPTRQEIEARL